jgi:hypothetical protein
VIVGLIGGSASTNIYLPAAAKTWPELLVDLQGQECELHVRQQGMLTISRALPLASSFPEVDVLLLSFATTLGWPVISKRISRLLVPEFQSETALHLAAFPSRSRAKRFKKRLRRLALNTLKYCAYPFGLYRPTNNLGDLDDQVRALISIALTKAPTVVWIQHQPMRDSRIWLERRMFDRYYKQLTGTLSRVSEKNFRLVEFPEAFMDQKNFCLDEVHLSELGHQNLAHYLHQAGVLKT